MENQQNKLLVFQNKDIRRIWQDEEWFYSVVDIIEVLTDSPTPRQYWGKVKDRIGNLQNFHCPQFGYG